MMKNVGKKKIYRKEKRKIKKSVDEIRHLGGQIRIKIKTIFWKIVNPNKN